MKEKQKKGLKRPYIYTLVDEKAKEIKLDLDDTIQELNKLYPALQEQECKLQAAEKHWNTADDLSIARKLLHITQNMIKYYESQIEEAKLNLCRAQEELPKQFSIQDLHQHVREETHNRQITKAKQVESVDLLLPQIQKAQMDRTRQIITQLYLIIENRKYIDEVNSFINTTIQKKAAQEATIQPLQDILDRAEYILKSTQQEHSTLQKRIKQTEQKYYKLEQKLHKLLDIPSSLICREQLNEESFINVEGDNLEESLEETLNAFIIGDEAFLCLDFYFSTK